MHQSQGTRLIAAATLSLGLMFSMSACSVDDLGRQPVAAENSSRGITVTEQDVQTATIGWKKFLVANGENPDSYDATKSLYYLSIEPLLAKAADDLKVGISMDDARRSFEEQLAAIKSNKVGADLPETNDPVVRLWRFQMLNQALGKVDQKNPGLESAVKEFQSGMATGWTFGPRYGSFSMTPQQGAVGIEPSRPWLDKYVPLAGDPALNPVDTAPNGRPADQARSENGQP